MPIKQAAIKDLRKNRKRAARNKKIKTSLRNLVKENRKNIETEKMDEQILKKTISEIDRAVRKKIIKKNTAARKKSRLFKHLKKVQAKKS